MLAVIFFKPSDLKKIFFFLLVLSLCHLGIVVWQCCFVRDVSLPLFGGIPLFFWLSAFLKMIFRFFWKIANKKIFFRVPTLPLSTDRRASVNSQWRLGLPVCASSVSGWNSKAPYLHTALKIWRPQPCCVGVQRGLPGRGRGEGDHQTQAFAPPPFPLSSHHTHTHTHTLTFRAASCYDFAIACHGQSLHATLAPKMLRSFTFRWDSVVVVFFQAFRFFKNNFPHLWKIAEKKNYRYPTSPLSGEL